MDIYINGSQLHIAKGDVVLNWSNIRFSEAVSDEWSTEIEMPNDPHNITLLGAWGMLDRGAVFNRKTVCSVDIDGIGRDGYMQVLSIDENTIKARVYINVIPYEVLDKKVCEYYPHDDVVFRWDRFSPVVTNIAGVNEGIIPYDYTSTDFYSNILAQWHASVNVGKIIDNIQVAEDITLPAVDNVLFQIAAKKVVCPSNPYQVMMGNLLHSDAITDKNLDLSGGQHITNDFKSSWSYADFHWNYDWSDWVVESTNEKWMTQAETMSEITFNRPVNAHIKVYACASHIGGVIIPKKNGESLAPAPASFVPVLTNPNWTENDILIFDDTVGFDDGDVLTLHYSGSAQIPRRNVRYSVVIEYTDYEWDDDDYGEELVYIPAPFGIWGIRDIGSDWAYDFKYDFNGTGDGSNGPEDYSFTYFGAYSNLEREMSVREYLTNLCWIHNLKLKLDRNELTFQNANQSSPIGANLTLIEPSSDKLARRNTITYRDSETPVVFSIDNEFLEDEMTLHENNFYTADIIPQYSYDMTYSDETNSEGSGWVTDINVKFEDLSPVIMTAVWNGTRYWLKHAPDLQGFGLPEMANAQQITAETLDDIARLDYVYIDGHKYMLIDGETDLNTYITEFKALQCDWDMGCIPPTFAIMETVPYETSITVMYSYMDIQGDSTGTVTVFDVERPDVIISTITDITYTSATATVGVEEGQEEQIIQRVIEKGVTSVTFDDLIEGETYRIVFTVTNPCGNNIEEQVVVDTQHNAPPVVNILGINNVSDASATARVGFHEIE